MTDRKPGCRCIFAVSGPRKGHVVAVHSDCPVHATRPINPNEGRPAEVDASGLQPDARHKNETQAAEIAKLRQNLESSENLRYALDFRLSRQNAALRDALADAEQMLIPMARDFPHLHALQDLMRRIRAALKGTSDD